MSQEMLKCKNYAGNCFLSKKKDRNCKKSKKSEYQHILPNIEKDYVKRYKY